MSGMDKMSVIMENLRKNPLEEIAGYKVASVIDYEKTEETGLPKANVLVYKLENNETVIAVSYTHLDVYKRQDIS